MNLIGDQIKGLKLVKNWKNAIFEISRKVVVICVVYKSKFIDESKHFCTGINIFLIF